MYDKYDDSTQAEEAVGRSAQSRAVTPRNARTHRAQRRRVQAFCRSVAGTPAPTNAPHVGGHAGLQGHREERFGSSSPSPRLPFEQVRHRNKQTALIERFKTKGLIKGARPIVLWIGYDHDSPGFGTSLTFAGQRRKLRKIWKAIAKIRTVRLAGPVANCFPMLALFIAGANQRKRKIKHGRHNGT